MKEFDKKRTMRSDPEKLRTTILRDFSKEAQLTKNKDLQQKTRLMRIPSKKPKTKKCRYAQCNKDFIPTGISHICCDYRCAIDYAKEKESKRKKKEIAQGKKELRNNDRAVLKKDCQKIANRIGKLQNYLKGEFRCVTCGNENPRQDGGHCFSVGSYPPIRYYTIQIRPQCVHCNRHKGGMYTEFISYLSAKIGEDKVQLLSEQKGKITKKHTVEYLRKYKTVMGRRLRVLEKRYAER